jgi:hypothetical protein
LVGGKREGGLVTSIESQSTFSEIDASQGSPVPFAVSTRVSTVADQTACLLGQVVDGMIWCFFLEERDSVCDAAHSFNASRRLNGPAVTFWILAIVTVGMSAPATSQRFTASSHLQELLEEVIAFIFEDLVIARSSRPSSLDLESTIVRRSIELSCELFARLCDAGVTALHVFGCILLAERSHLSLVSHSVIDMIPIICDVAFVSEAITPNPSHDQRFDPEHRIAIFAFISGCTAMLQIRAVVAVIISHIAAIRNRVQPSSAAVLADSAVRVPADGNVQIVQRVRVEGLAGEIAFGTMKILWICEVSVRGFSEILEMAYRSKTCLCWQ